MKNKKKVRTCGNCIYLVKREKVVSINIIRA